MNKVLLDGMKVMVTRPEPAGSVLCEMVNACGGVATYVPTIAFDPAPDQQEYEQAIAAIGEQDWLVFVSPQAVYASVPAIRKNWPVLPPGVKLAAIGLGTATALEEAGYKTSVQPEGIWNSESLTEMPALQEVENQNIAIVRGEGGQEILEKIFGERGANVLSIIAYKRTVPGLSEEQLEDIKNNSVDAVVCASFEGVKNLKLILGQSAWPVLASTPLIVISDRIKILARELGFKTIWVAKNAAHDSIINCLAEKKDEIWQIKQISI